MAEVQVKCFDNWRNLLTTVKLSTDQYDARTNMYCRNDAMDRRAYCDYVRFCISLREVIQGGKVEVQGQRMSRFVSGDHYMLDLGYVPITMCPSYWDQGICMAFVHALSSRGIQSVPRKAIGLAAYQRSTARQTAMPEWWVSKMDVAQVLGCNPLKVGLEEVLSLC